jgi:hypothetical protein
MQVRPAGSSQQVSNRQQVTGAEGQLQLGFTKLSLSISEHLRCDVSLSSLTSTGGRPLHQGSSHRTAGRTGQHRHTHTHTHTYTQRSNSTPWSQDPQTRMCTGRLDFSSGRTQNSKHEGHADSHGDQAPFKKVHTKKDARTHTNTEKQR